MLQTFTFTLTKSMAQASNPRAISHRYVFHEIHLLKMNIFFIFLQDIQRQTNI